MPSFSTDGRSYFVSYVTGPQHVMLGLELTCFACGEPAIAKLPACGACHHGEIDETQLVRAVLHGVEQACEAQKTRYYVRGITYVENDSPNCDLYQHCAILLIQRRASGGEFTARPELAASTTPQTLLAFDWLDPWGPVPEPDRPVLENELQKELGDAHRLRGKRVTVVGRNRGTDDVLFVVHTSPPHLAMVHLTWRKEDNPKWPWTETYPSAEAWVNEYMRPEHDGWSDYEER